MAEPRHYEYYVETIGSAWKVTSDDDLQAVLNELGQSGWEVISVEHQHNSPKIRLVARRPLHAPTPKNHGWP